ncbi:MAG: maleylpyruvate isomerase N-terminal domain-containing protein [Mycobacterium sp.]|nr:maleylpyruvate isomerase N-terminal domain-containing protein [Mycobacterium sp.]
MDRATAFRDQRADVLAFCTSLGPADWRMNSRAEGWSIADVVGHMAAGCHAMFGPAVLRIMRAADIEQTNEKMVELRRERTPAQVLGEYRRWSRVFAAALPALTHKPLARFELPLGELGRFPARVLPSALVFDHHTHLSHDMAPALGRVVPVPDANRMSVVLEWMMAVLSNQIRSAQPAWLDRPLRLTLAGPGGGSWHIDRSGVATAFHASPAAEINALAMEFPEWGTRRAGWRDRDVSVSGDTDYASAFLDWINIV